MISQIKLTCGSALIKIGPKTKIINNFKALL